MNKAVLTIVLVALFIVAFGGGYYFGNKSGLQTGRNEIRASLEPIIQTIYPKPPEDLRVLTGTVKGIYGGTLRLEIFNPDDYLPHADGSPRTTQLRNAITTAETKFVSIDYSKLDTRGNPKITSLAVSAMHVGMKVTVHADHNIRAAEQFDVTKVEVVKL